jgi:protein TonB
MVGTVLRSPGRERLAIALLVAALHLAGLLALIQAFAPQIGNAVLQPVTAAFNVSVTAPPPPPPPSKPAARPVRPSSEGAAAPAGRKAVPKEVTAPSPRIVVNAPVAPPIAGGGSDNSAGALDTGQGTGAGGSGRGLGSGGQGAGTGAGGAKVAKVSGDIVSARDYPRATRALRLGSSVTVSLTVGIDGKAKDCRIVRASPDPEADRITCRLAVERFRFDPARDATGRPIEAVYGWQQRWFAPGTK